MMIVLTQSGGRLLNGDTPWGRFHVEWDASGKLVAESIELKVPDQHRSPIVIIPGPGDLLDAMIKGVGVEDPNCPACDARRTQMNAWWHAMFGNEPMTLARLRKYLKAHRHAIEGWLDEEAAKRGIEVTLAMKAKAIAAGVRYWRARKGAG